MAEDFLNFSANEETPPISLSKETLDVQSIYQLFGVGSENRFVFTSSGAEAINQVLWSVFLKVSRETGKCHFITSHLEDAATLQMMNRLEELGCFVKIAPVNSQGEIDVQKLKELISPRTALISISIAQGMTGVIQPIEEIGAIAQEKKIPLHLDATHAAGKFYISFEELKATYLTFSGDKIHANLASGGLFAKKDAPLVPLILGETSLRAGKIDPISFNSLCQAAKEASLFLDTMSLEIARLRDFFEKEITRLIPSAQILCKEGLRLPNTTVISFPKAHQEALFSLLLFKKTKPLLGGNEMQHIYPLLTGMDISESLAECALHFSFDRTMTQEKILHAINVIKESFEFLANISINTPKTPLFIKAPIALNKKLKEKIHSLRFVGSFSENDAKMKGMRYVEGKENNVIFYLLVDETDGVIADVKFQAFGPLALIAAAEILSELVIRKNYVQASRITADLIESTAKTSQEETVFPSHFHGLLNQLLSAIDHATQSCSDISCNSQSYDMTPIEWDSSAHPDGIPGWDTFSLEQKKHLIEEVIHKDIRPYIELDSGGVTIHELKENNELFIAYAGSCTTCHSATGSTLSAIQQILRAKIHPAITVIPVF